MTVKELIEQLSKCNPDLVVGVCDSVMGWTSFSAVTQENEDDVVLEY